MSDDENTQSKHFHPDAVTKGCFPAHNGPDGSKFADGDVAKRRREVIVYECDTDGSAADVERALDAAAFKGRRVDRAATLDKVLRWIEPHAWGGYRTASEPGARSHTHVVRDADGDVIGSGASAHDATLDAIRTAISELQSERDQLRARIIEVSNAVKVLRGLDGEP